MDFTAQYDSPLGTVTLAGDGDALIGLWFNGQKYFGAGLDRACQARALPVFDEAMRWLDIYFSGREPGFTPPLRLRGSPFQTRVWSQLLQIPYGRTVTYGQLAARVAAAQGIERTSAQAVGGAVARNAISLMIPCHRVVGADGSLIGYAGGVDKKIRLLRLEGADTDALFMPKTGKAQ